MESVIKNALGIIIGNKDIEGADGIVYETEIYKAVVIIVPGPVNVFNFF